jgi:hypothetical protein
VSRLIAVHAPVAPLGDLLVISVELWDQAIYVHLARLDDEAGQEVPESPDTGIGRELRLTDDLGTPYEQRSGHSGGFPAPVWRAEWQFEPGVPAAAKRLTLSLGDDSLELTL